VLCGVSISYIAFAWLNHGILFPALPLRQALGHRNTVMASAMNVGNLPSKLVPTKLIL